MASLGPVVQFRVDDTGEVREWRLRFEEFATTDNLGLLITGWFDGRPDAEIVDIQYAASGDVSLALVTFREPVEPAAEEDGA